MREYLSKYVETIDNKLKDESLIVGDELINNHLIKISFFQHERLIHLLVTLAYAILLSIFIILIKYYSLLSAVVLILSMFLIFYVRHYFFLENNVQYLYKQYDELLKRKNK